MVGYTFHPTVPFPFYQCRSEDQVGPTGKVDTYLQLREEDIKKHSTVCPPVKDFSHFLAPNCCRLPLEEFR